MALLECSRAFIVVFIGLVLGTAGFCLTLAGWFAPPINDSVRGVRMAGPVLLVIGLLILLFSCLLCAVSQQLCCHRCLQFCYDRQKDLYEDHLARTVHVNVNHTNVDAKIVDNDHPLILGDMQDAFDACNIANRYAGISPVHRYAHQSKMNHTEYNQHYNQQPYDGRYSTVVGYHESEVTDSTETPSTSPTHQPMLYDGNSPSPVHRTMYEGLGVRVKQFRSHDPPHLGADDIDTNKQLLDYSIHSSSHCSNPTWMSPPPPISPSHSPKDNHQYPISDEPTQKRPERTPSLTRKNSDKVTLPKPGLYLDRDPNKGGGGVSGASGIGPGPGVSPKVSKGKDCGPVWTPRAARWGSPSLQRHDPNPPPYKDPLVMHSDV